MNYLGIDLAWGERNVTGLAALESSGRLIASGSVRSDDEIANFVEQYTPGEVVAAIDAPLVVPNASGRRECEALLQADFGRYDAGAHSSNRSHAWFDPPRGATLVARFGWEMDPEVAPASGTSVAIEVYPHPAMVTLFDLDRVLPYKNKKGRTTSSRKAAFGKLMAATERLCDEPLQLSSSARWAHLCSTVEAAQRPMHLSALEDEVDAIFCAYLAWLWGHGDARLRVLGDVRRGYIVVPGPPDREAARGRTPASVGQRRGPVMLGLALRERVADEALLRGLTDEELIASALDALPEAGGRSRLPA